MINGFDLSTISDLYVGSTQASAIYYGSNLIWSHGAHDYSKDFLTFVAIESGTFTFTDTVNSNSVLYSVDGGQVWQTLQSGDSTPTVNAGDKIMWQCFHPSVASSANGMGKFSSTGTFNITGNIMSMYDGDRFSTAGTTTLPNSYQFSRLFYQSKVVDASNLILPATTLSDYCYNGMFYVCTSLTTAPELPATTLASYCYNYMLNGCTSLTTAPELPATTLASYCYNGMFYGCTSLTTAPELPATTLANSCYQRMFWNCTSLTSAPELPATTLASYCYNYMFSGCTGLIVAPELPATTLADNCYSYMFSGCTSLTTAPELPATTLVKNCYRQMFDSCTSLNYIKCLATNMSASSCTSSWLRNVNSSGDFYKDSSVTWFSGNNGIPNGWTIHNIE